MITTKGFEAAAKAGAKLDREEASRIKKVDAKAALAAQTI